MWFFVVCLILVCYFRDTSKKKKMTKQLCFIMTISFPCLRILANDSIYNKIKCIRYGTTELLRIQSFWNKFYEKCQSIGSSFQAIKKNETCFQWTNLRPFALVSRLYMYFFFMSLAIRFSQIFTIRCCCCCHFRSLLFIRSCFNSNSCEGMATARCMYACVWMCMFVSTVLYSILLTQQNIQFIFSSGTVNVLWDQLMKNKNIFPK